MSIALILVLTFLVSACVADPTPQVPAAPDVSEPAAPDVSEPAAPEEVEKPETTTIDVWFHSGKGEEREVLDEQVTTFNTMQDEVYVNAVILPEGSYNEQVNSAALASDLPCLLDFDGPFLYNYAWAGYLIPLDDYVSKEMRDDFLPSIIDQGTYAGQLYSLGTFDSGLSLWANKAYLEEAGIRIPTSIDDAWTMEEFMDALQKLKDLEQVEYPLDLKFNYGPGDEWNTYGFSPFIQAFGGDLIDRTDFQSADGILNGPETVEALEWFQSLVEDGYVNPSPAGDDSFYGSKTAALAYVGHWMYGPHTQGLGEDAIVLPMPILGEKAVTGSGSWNWGITSNCKAPDAAFKFLNFLVDPDEILHMTNANGAVPARKSAIAKSELYAEGGLLNLFVQQLEGGVAVPRPQTPAYPTITNAFKEVIWNIIAGADVKTELDKAVRFIDQDILDNDGYPFVK